MERIRKSVSMRELALTGISAVLAVVCGGRICLLFHAQGSVYTMGILPLALLFGLYCLWKGALFLENVFFPVFVRAFLAAGFAALQVMGLVFGHPGICGVWEAVLWILCFTPLTFAGQNMLCESAERRGGGNCGRRKNCGCFA